MRFAHTVREGGKGQAEITAVFRGPKALTARRYNLHREAVDGCGPSRTCEFCSIRG
jgi:hypothetical protein